MRHMYSTSSILPQLIISAQQLTQSINIQGNRLDIFEKIDLDINAGEQVAITGRSGSGKSTLLGILATLDQASGGQLFINGEAIHQLDEEKRALLRSKLIGFVFQSFQLLPSLSALENVLLPLRIQPDFNYKVAEKSALNLLEKVGLSHRFNQSPKVLSGGEQQRVAIARALITQPKIIFADEPTGNLDEETAIEIEELLFDLNREYGTTLILVTHNVELANKCQRHLELRNGKLIEHDLKSNQLEGL